MFPRHNEVVRLEIESMLKAGLITPASWARPFPFVVTRKDRKTRFCVDYCVLNWKLKLDRFLLPTFQEFFDVFVGGAAFTTLGLVSGYWQIRLSEI